jgi:hypothetical protein
METRGTTSTATTAPAGTHTHTDDTPATMAHIRVWYILIGPDNKPFGKPFRVHVLDDKYDILELREDIKKGPYKEDLAHVNVNEMEVWRCQSLTLLGLDPDGIGELVRNLKLSRDEDSDGKKVGGWTQVMSLKLDEYEPLVVRVQPKGAQRLFLRIILPAELTVLNSNS